jgi:CheY-like chemotaxis protein
MAAYIEDSPHAEIVRPLPALPPKASESSPEIMALLESVKDAKKTLLIIEDDLVFANLVADTAKTYGFTPVQAHTGETALQILERHTPTAIMLDIKLPGISGFGILETIKEMPHLRHIPVHMISALDYSRYTLRMGAMGFLGKPVSIEKLREAIGQLDTKANESTRKLLVVEDNDTQRKAIEQLLNGPDIKLDAVGTGELALQAVRAQRYDCIVLDLALPDMSGKDFLEKLDEMNVPLPPVIVYTAKDLSRREEEYLRKYSESIILKGARSPERLLDEVNLFLHRVEDGLHDSQREILQTLRLAENIFRGKRALLVDDDLRNVFALTHVLESKGFEVVVARDGVEAVEACAKSDRYDVVLMDLMMPRMDGFQAMKQIREMESRKETPIIALTAKAMKGDHEKALEAGANDYLPKPINIASLITVLKVWVKEKEIFS